MTFYEMLNVSTGIDITAEGIRHLCAQGVFSMDSSTVRDPSASYDSSRSYILGITFDNLTKHYVTPTTGW